MIVRFILFGLFFYIILRLLRMVVFTRRTSTVPPHEAAGRAPNSIPPRIDKTKAAEADFEEIKEK